MPRTARASRAGWCYHALNRGNRRAEVFHSERDYADLARLLRQACARVPMRLLAYCLMPNHFHLVLWPLGDDDLGRWMQWLLTTHVRRYRSSGRVWQGRFKAFPIEQDDHLLRVLRYVERNPLRAGLVARAEAWPWSRMRWWGQAPGLPLLDPGPVARGDDWIGYVNTSLHEGELRRLRQSGERGTPYGWDAWVVQTAAALGLEAALHRPGRPAKGSVPGTVRPDTPGLFPE